MRTQLLRKRDAAIDKATEHRSKYGPGGLLLRRDADAYAQACHWTGRAQAYDDAINLFDEFEARLKAMFA